MFLAAHAIVKLVLNIAGISALECVTYYMAIVSHTRNDSARVYAF